MKRVGKVAAGIAALMMTAGTAVAADVPQMVVPAAPLPPAPTFAWAGPYVGVAAGRLFIIGTPIAQNEAMVLAGYNVVNGNLLFGAQVNLGIGFVLNPFNYDFKLGFDARVGMLVNDSTLIYAIAGLFRYQGAPLAWRAGLGVERAVGESMSIFVEAAVVNIFPVDDWTGVVMGGVNWHLGR